MRIICSISGCDPEDPVISKHGYVFEKRLIEKAISETGQCPITGNALALEDLKRIIVSGEQKAIPIESSSLPELLSSFQAAWEELLTDSFKQKAQLDSVQEQLAQCLYEQEATTRIIAELERERDLALSEVARLQEELGQLHYRLSD
jgi:pre-mRNA-processing factor 19